MYILGIGSTGKYMAHALAGDPRRPPVSLLTYKPRKHWDGQAIQLYKEGVAYVRRGFTFERIHTSSPTRASTDQSAVRPLPRRDFTREAYISQIIVTTSYTETVRALSDIKHRLDNLSTILFLQQGPGILREVNEQVFPNPETRPIYMLGFLTHILHSRFSGWTIETAGFGTTYLTTVPHELGSTPQRWKYLLRRLQRSPGVGPVLFPYTQYLVLQLEKLAIRAVIGSLTAVFDCLNGELLHNGRIDRIMRLMLSEISLVIRSLPELQSVPNLEARFDPDRLETIVATVAKNTSNCASSMRREVNDGLAVQIDATVGYIVRRGEELGISCVMNYMIMQMVLGRSLMVQQRNSRALPFK